MWKSEGEYLFVEEEGFEVFVIIT